jgi:hypothetical protein
LKVGASLRQFQCASRAFARNWALDFGFGSFTEEYDYEGGSLGFCSGEFDYPQGERRVVRAGIWTGESYSLFTFMYGGRSSDLVDVFEAIDLDESPDGVTITPRDGTSLALSDAGFQVPRMLKNFTSVASVESRKLTAFITSTLPTETGMPVEGGELFQLEHEDGRYLLVLVGESAYTRIIPRRGALESDVMALAGSLAIEWASTT